MQLLKRSAWLAMLVPAAIGLWLRLMLAGGPPFTDGGTYQYNAWLAHEVVGSLPTAPINFYSWLASLLGQSPDTPFLRARMLDAGACAGAAAAFGWLLCRVTRWPVAALLGATWAVLASAPVFADAGFKNPIAAASLPLFVAVGLLVRPGDRGALRAGMLVALACLLREAFAPAAVLMPLLALLARGRRAALRCLLGGAIGAAIATAWMLLAGIDPAAALENLRAMSKNASELLLATGADPSQLRVDALRRALEHAWPLLLPTVLAAALLLRPRRPELRRLAAVAVLLLLPLVEIFGKFCLPYHWQQLTPALLLLAAIGDRRLRALARLRGSWRPLRVAGWLVLLLGAALGSAALRRDYEAGFYWHRIYRPVMADGDWSNPVTQQSRYLQIAHWLRLHTAPDARVMVSGYGYVIYPLSRRRPASVEVSDLTFSRMTDQASRHPEWLAALRADPPEVVVETLRWPEPLQAVWPDFERRYELAVTFPDDAQVHYGNFAARLWRLRR